MKKITKKILVISASLFLMMNMSCNGGNNDNSGSIDSNYSEITSGSSESEIQSNSSSSSESIDSTSSNISESEEDIGLKEERNFLISEITDIYNKIDLSLYSPNGKKQLLDIFNDEKELINSLISHEEIRSYDYNSYKSKLNSINKLDYYISNDIFISEFFNIGYDKDYNPTGNNQNKAIELYNPLDVSVDLSAYCIYFYSSGCTEVKDSNYIINLSEVLESKKTYTIVNSYAEDSLKAKADLVTNVYIGPKSSVGLYKNDKLIDTFGVIGKAYASNDEFVINEIPAAADMHNVIRKPGYTACSEFIEDQWSVEYFPDFTTLGHHLFSEKQNVSYEDSLKSMVELWSGDFTGDFVDLVKLCSSDESFDYKFVFYDSTYIDNKGKIIKEPEDGFTLAIGIQIYDKEGNFLKEDYPKAIYRKGNDYATHLQEMVELWTTTIDGSIDELIEEFSNDGTYDFIYSLDKTYFDEKGVMINIPNEGTDIILGISILDENGNIKLTSYSHMTYESN